MFKWQIIEIIPSLWIFFLEFGKLSKIISLKLQDQDSHYPDLGIFNIFYFLNLFKKKMSVHIFVNLFAVYGFKNVAVFDKTNALFGCNTHTHSRLKIEKKIVK